MADALRYEIGDDVRCADAADCGELTQVILDPVARRLTHLVIVPPPTGSPRLVPVSLARPTGVGIQLAAGGQDLGYRNDQVLSWPFFGLAPGGAGLTLAAPEPALVPTVEVEQRIPVGEVKIRRGERVHAEDGDIGRVQGLIVDPADESVTHVLLDEGHLWGKKQVAIPVGAVGVSEDGVTVRMT